MNSRKMAPHLPDHTSDDLTLMHRVAAGDPQAFEQLYQRYAPRLMRYLQRLLQHHDLAEEVLNEVWLIVWQQAARYEQRAPLSSWLFGIAHHRVLKAWARTGKQLPALFTTAADRQPQEDLEAHLEHQELTHLVRQAVATLPAEQHAVVTLTYDQGCSLQEIATIIGCPLNTVKTRLLRARRRLAVVLEKMGVASTPAAPAAHTLDVHFASPYASVLSC